LDIASISVWPMIRPAPEMIAAAGGAANQLIPEKTAKTGGEGRITARFDGALPASVRTLSGVRYSASAA
jgi:hypothetical protein